MEKLNLTEDQNDFDLEAHFGEIEDIIEPIPNINPEDFIHSPKGKGGVNQTTEGFENNTKLGPGKHSGDSDPDRHCFRKSKKGKGAMKCMKCQDYNRGVEIGSCTRCLNNNFEEILSECTICGDQNKGVALGKCLKCGKN